MIYLLLGGARSGKSSLAEEMALNLEGDEVYYLATARSGDDEMKKRIENHKKNRPASWQTIEEPLSPGEAISSLPFSSIILLDCITMLVSNLLLEESEVDRELLVKKEIEKIIKEGENRNLIIVTNEVGMGIVPDKKLARKYRDLLGWTNQYLAQKADRVYLVVAGIPVGLKELETKLT
ncbi:MAG: bifunctional adenosylcobinamide kinase/adenosylcobinamide-phosphate guanylyltransferase [Halanaerobiales bacterium]